MERKGGVFGILALIFGIVGILTGCIGIGIVLDILAVIFGIIAIVKNQKKGLGITGLILGIVGVISFIIIIATVGLFSLGSSDSETTNVSNNGNGSSIEKADYSNDINVIEYPIEYGDNASIYALLVTNDSSDTVDIECNVNVYDSEDNLINYSTEYISALESNKQDVAQYYFDNLTDSYRFEYDLTVKKSNYVSYVDDMTIKENPNGDTIIIEIENPTDYEFDFPKVECLFYKNGECVYSDYTYLTSDIALESNGKGQGRLSTPFDYDEYKTYYSIYR